MGINGKLMLGMELTHGTINPEFYGSLLYVHWLSRFLPLPISPSKRGGLKMVDPNLVAILITILGSVAMACVAYDYGEYIKAKKKEA